MGKVLGKEIKSSSWRNVDVVVSLGLLGTLFDKLVGRVWSYGLYWEIMYL